MPNDPAVFHIDPGAEVVGEAGALRADHRIQVLPFVRRRIVVVRYSQLEREPGHAGNGRRRDPRDARNRRLDTHNRSLTLSSNSANPGAPQPHGPPRAAPRNGTKTPPPAVSTSLPWNRSRRRRTRA